MKCFCQKFEGEGTYFSQQVFSFMESTSLFNNSSFGAGRNFFTDETRTLLLNSIELTQ
jgi:hypothetical protein